MASSEAESMARERFKELGTGSLFGGYLYERAVPADHFLRQLEAVVDWDAFKPTLIRLYRGKAKGGRPRDNPVVILQFLVLAYLNNLSERQMEQDASAILSLTVYQ